MSNLSFFLMDYWHQDSDLLYESIEDALLAYKAENGDSKFHSLIEEIRVRLSQGQFQRNERGVPIYEKAIGGQFQVFVDEREAQSIVAKFGKIP